MSDTNGHGKDLGWERDLRPVKPCCEVVRPGVWCQKPTGHSGDHYAVVDPAPLIGVDYSKGRVKK